LAGGVPLARRRAALPAKPSSLEAYWRAGPTLPAVVRGKASPTATIRRTPDRTGTRRLVPRLGRRRPAHRTPSDRAACEDEATPRSIGRAWLGSVRERGSTVSVSEGRMDQDPPRPPGSNSSALTRNSGPGGRVPPEWAKPGSDGGRRSTGLCLRRPGFTDISLTDAWYPTGPPSQTSCRSRSRATARGCRLWRGRQGYEALHARNVPHLSRGHRRRLRSLHPDRAHAAMRRAPL
jgi:hypothetical protein